MKIIITILVILLGLAGGAYYAQDSGLYDFKQLKQYIPSQVQEILNIEDTEVVSVESEQLEAITDMDQQQNISDSDQNDFFAGNSNSASQANQDSQVTKTEEKPATNQTDTNTVGLSEDHKDKVSDSTRPDTISPNASDTTKSKASNNHNIQTAMLDTATTKGVEENTSEPKSNIQVLDASPEEMKMVKELNKVESKIVKLDNEKEILEKKYYQMIKKNRELAMKIKEIDLQIKAIESK